MILFESSFWAFKHENRLAFDYLWTFDLLQNSSDVIFRIRISEKKTVIRKGYNTFKTTVSNNNLLTMLVGTWACALDSKLSHFIFEEGIVFYTPLVHLPTHVFTRIILGRMMFVWPNSWRSNWRRINLGFNENLSYSTIIYTRFISRKWDFYNFLNKILPNALLDGSRGMWRSRRVDREENSEI